LFIHPNIYLVSGIISNCYILSDTESLSIVDCGVSRDAKKILKKLTELGYPEKHLKNILITHADGDHYGSALKVHDFTKALIFSNSIEKEAIEKGGSSRPLKSNRFLRFFTNLLSPLFAASPVGVDETLSDTQVLPILTGIQVLETPGHTPGHVSFWLEEPRILFAGDSIWESSGKPIASTGMNTWDLELSKRSFDSQMSLHPKIICAGHTCLFLK
jgi:glyoxylase-like metal-dependent hydrolase (beta-lactamase superfamily II)